MRILKRLAASLLIAVLLCGTFSVTNAEAALSKPGNCRFYRWIDNPATEKLDFTACTIAWNRVSGADYYQYMWNRTDGVGKTYTRITSAKYHIGVIKGLARNRIYKVHVRAIKVNSKGKVTSRSGWSNAAFITPLPITVNGSMKGSNSVRFSWNRIYSSAGYIVYFSTSPNGKYYRVATTAKSANTSAIISKFRGSKLKTYQNYYVRIVPRLKVAGKYLNVAVPSGLVHYSFYIYNVYK